MDGRGHGTRRRRILMACWMMVLALADTGCQMGGGGGGGMPIAEIVGTATSVLDTVGDTGNLEGPTNPSTSTQTASTSAGSSPAPAGGAGLPDSDQTGADNVVPWRPGFQPGAQDEELAGPVEVDPPPAQPWLSPEMQEIFNS